MKIRDVIYRTEDGWQVLLNGKWWFSTSPGRYYNWRGRVGNLSFMHEARVKVTS